MKFEKTTMNQLSIGDSFAWLNNGLVYTVSKIEGDTISYISNGREYNCRYDEGRCRKVIK